MSDFCFAPLREIPAGWKEIARSCSRMLLIDENAGPVPCRVWQNHGLVVAVLSHALTPEQLLARIRRNDADFQNYPGTAAGLLWNTRTDEYALFRDNFGMIPVLGSWLPDGALFTTSPALRWDLHAQDALNWRWFAKFLREEDDTGTEDCWEHAFRVCPGEVVYGADGGLAAFLKSFADAWACPAEATDAAFVRQNKGFSTRSFWQNRRYTCIGGDPESLARELREEIGEAVERLPNDNLCFTLSGGLDSTGILATRCIRHPEKIRAVSLISHRHASCDESRELDVLERAFPIDLLRVDMDGFVPMSEPGLYRRYRGYGPVLRPGMEFSLGLYRAVQERWGRCTMVTGYGGNFLVKVRPEALWFHLLASGNVAAMWRELRGISASDLRFLVHRLAGNVAGGRLKRLFGRTPEVAPWIQPGFAEAFPPAATDPVCFLSHRAERAYLPQTWIWELQMRALAILARETPHRYEDPLFDLDVYDHCACIPPHFMEPCGRYRVLYKEALRPLLPEEILHHPKCQHFDALLECGIAENADLLRPCLQNGATEVFFRPGVLQNQLDAFCVAPEKQSLGLLWRSLATCLWME